MEKTRQKSLLFFAALAMVCLWAVTPRIAAQLQAAGCAKLLQQSRLTDAEVCARSVLAMDPRNALADEVVGAVRLRQNDFAMAILMLREAIRLEPGLVGARIDLGNALALEGKYSDAEDDFRQVLRHAPHNFEAIFALVRLENAQSHFRKSLQAAQPINSGLRRRADGLTVLISDELALSEKVAVDALLADWTKLDKPSTSDSIALVEVLASSHDEPDAIAILSRVAGNQPNHSEVHFLLGELYLKTHETEMARREFNATLMLQANCMRCLYELGRLADAEHRLPEAKELLLRARTLRSDDADILIGLGKVALEMDLPDEAILSLSAAVKLRPGSEPAQYLLASAYTSDKNFGESTAVLTGLITLHPEDPLFSYSLGAVMYLAGDYSSAETQLRNSLVLDPKGIGALYYLSLTLRKQEKLEEAEKVLRSLLSEAPQHPAGLEALGELLLAKHRYTEAKTILEQAAKLDPGSANAHYMLGRTLARLGERDASKQEFALVESLAGED